MEAGVGLHPVFALQAPREVAAELERLEQRPPVAARARPDRGEIGRLGVGAAEDDARTGRSALQDGIPFPGERVQPVRAEPVHVVEQHVSGNRLPRTLEELGDRAGIHRDPVGKTVLQREEIYASEILGAAAPRVAAADVYRPEVVHPHRQVERDVLDRIAHESGHAARVLALDLPALGVRDAEERHRELAGERPAHRPGPEPRLDARVVDGALLVERLRIEQRFQRVAEPGLQREIAAKGARDHTREPAEVERLAGVAGAEPAALAVPILARELRELVAQQVGVDLAERGVPRPSPNRRKKSSKSRRRMPGELEHSMDTPMEDH